MLSNKTYLVILTFLLTFFVTLAKAAPGAKVSEPYIPGTHEKVRNRSLEMTCDC